MDKKLVGAGGTFALVAGTVLYTLVGSAAVGDNVTITEEIIDPIDETQQTDATTAIQSWSPSTALADVTDYHCRQSREGDDAGTWYCACYDDGTGALTDAQKGSLVGDGQLNGDVRGPVLQTLDSAMETSHNALAAHCAGATQLSDLNDFSLLRNGDASHRLVCHDFDVKTDAALGTATNVIVVLGEVLCLANSACANPTPTCSGITSQCEACVDDADCTEGGLTVCNAGTCEAP